MHRLLENIQRETKLEWEIKPVWAGPVCIVASFIEWELVGDITPQSHIVHILTMS